MRPIWSSAYASQGRSFSSGPKDRPPLVLLLHGVKGELSEKEIVEFSPPPALRRYLLRRCGLRIRSRPSSKPEVIDHPAQPFDRTSCGGERLGRRMRLDGQGQGSLVRGQCCREQGRDREVSLAKGY